MRQKNKERIFLFCFLLYLKNSRKNKNYKDAIFVLCVRDSSGALARSGAEQRGAQE